MNHTFGLLWLLFSIEVCFCCCLMNIIQRDQTHQNKRLYLIAITFACIIGIFQWAYINSFIPFAWVMTCLTGISIVLFLLALYRSLYKTAYLYGIGSCLLLSMNVFFITGLYLVSTQKQPHLELASISSVINHHATIGTDETLSDIPVFAKYIDKIHARITRKDELFYLQNMSYKKRLIRNHIGQEEGPHELPLLAGMKVVINGTAFSIKRISGIGMLKTISMIGPNKTVFFSHSFSTFVISTLNTAQSDAPVIQGNYKKHLAKIMYNFKLNRFILTYYDSRDKSSVHITYDKNKSLFKRQILITDGDVIVMGYTKFHFHTGPLNSIKLIPQYRIPRFHLLSNGHFIITNQLKSWISNNQFSLPVLFSTPITCNISQDNNLPVLQIVNSDNSRQQLQHGQSFKIEDQKGNAIKFRFMSHFYPKSVVDFFSLSSYEGSKTWFYGLLMIILLSLSSMILTNPKQHYTFPVACGTILLSCTGIIFLYRLEITESSFDGIALDHIFLTGIGIMILYLPSLLEKIFKSIHRLHLYQKRHKKMQHTNHSYKQLNEINNELKQLDNNAISLFTLFKQKSFFQLSLPSLFLVLLLLIFIIQRICGAETGIQVFYINIQIVFPVLVIMSFLLAFGTTEDLTIIENQVAQLYKNKSTFQLLLWRYHDIFLCFIFFFISMLFVSDITPIVIFTSLLIVSLFIRSRLNYQKIVVCICLCVIAIIIIIASFENILPYFPSFYAKRFGTWLNPFYYSSYSGQFIDNLWLLKHAGINGFGFGLAPKVNCLSQIKDDFILSLILSDAGLIGYLAILCSSCLVVIPCFMFACSETRTINFFTEHTENMLFYRQVVFWLAMLFLVQVLIVSCSVTGILPVMGTPFPFFGRGGSCLIFFSFLSMGIIMKAMKHKYYELFI